jgi:hypothetical protein
VTAYRRSISGVSATRLLALFFILFSANTVADKLAPSLFQIEEVQADNYQLLWRTPIGAKLSPEPILPESCQSDAAVGSHIVTVDLKVKRWQLKP